MPQTRRKIVGVIGPNEATSTAEMKQFAEQLGQTLANAGYRIACGGKQGIMEGVCRGAHQSASYREGNTIGILPDDEVSAANPWCDIVIPTGIGLARNQVIVKSADILIAISGGAGTLSEIAYAWQHGKIVICYTGFSGWAAKLAGKNLDNRHENLLLTARSLKETMELLSAHIPA